MATINEDILSRLDHPEEDLDVVEDALEYLLLRDPEVGVVVVGVRADVDDAVHVEVQVVELGDLVLLHHLAQAGVALAQPAVELGHSHDGGEGDLGVTVRVSRVSSKGQNLTLKADNYSKYPMTLVADSLSLFE